MNLRVALEDAVRSLSPTLTFFACSAAEVVDVDSKTLTKLIQ